MLQVYEDRADLIQAVIKGPQGSPYSDGLFFFDIQLPVQGCLAHKKQRPPRTLQ